MHTHLEYDEAEPKDNNRIPPGAAAEQLRAAPPKPLEIQGAYKAADYNSLPVGGEVKELFKMIQR